jgi:hypothetical protein
MSDEFEFMLRHRPDELGYERAVELRPVTYEELSVGDEVVLDGSITAVVTRTSVYVTGHGGRSGVREVGVSVRPLPHGRARPVQLHRLSKRVES